MEKYDYLEAMKADILEYIENEISLDEYAGRREDLEEDLSDDLWAADSVTGNASGSYYCNAWKAEEALCHNLDLLDEAALEFGCSTDIIGKGAEYCDVTIRCYLLGQAISAALDELDI